MGSELATRRTKISLQEQCLRWTESLAKGMFMAPETRARMRAEMDTPEARAQLAAMRETLQSATAEQIITHLSALALHYWTPDFTPAQQSRKFRDFCTDLRGVTETGLREACAAYRRDPKHEFFPKPGQLLALCRDDIRRRAMLETGLRRMSEMLRDGMAAEPEPGDMRTRLAGLAKTLNASTPGSLDEFTHAHLAPPAAT